MENSSNILRVAASTNIKSLAGSIAARFDVDHHSEVSIHAIGAGAVNQLVKSLVIAQDRFSPHGKKLCYVFGFHNVVIDEKECTAIVAKLHTETL